MTLEEFKTTCREDFWGRRISDFQEDLSDLILQLDDEDKIRALVFMIATTR